MTNTGNPCAASAIKLMLDARQVENLLAQSMLSLEHPGGKF
jgi:hypothetical protein